jgi:hypothetical protein
LLWSRLTCAQELPWDLPNEFKYFIDKTKVVTECLLVST